MSALKKLFEKNTIDNLATSLSKNYLKLTLAVRLAMLYSEIQNILIFTSYLKGEIKLNCKKIPLPICQYNMILEENPDLDQVYKNNLQDLALLINSMPYTTLRDGDKFEKDCAEEELKQKVFYLKRKIHLMLKEELKKDKSLISPNPEISDLISVLINSQTENDLP